jgi:hypothetical protein
LGLVPADGEVWFGGGKVVSLADDRLRNGQLLRSLCIVLRPEIFEGILPPAKASREMVDRNRQSLVILAEEGAIQEDDVELAEAVVRGEPEAIEGILRSVKNWWEERLRGAKKGIAGRLRYDRL